MADAENVVKAWNCCNPFNRKCKECPYEKDCYHDGISMHMVADAIELLKSQPKVVRCDDCEYSFCEGFVRERLYCEKHPELGEIKGDWFCADCWKA